MADTKLAKVGITVKEPWAADISYEALDYVLWRVQDGGDGCGYIAKKDNIGVQPGSDDETWEKGAQAGQSIYDLAVKYHHFEGTEEEFEAEYQAALAAANAAAAAASETNTRVQNAEDLRVAAEQSRVAAETARVDAESRRATAELTRDNDETARQAAEAIRSSNETGRVSAESGRASAESGRVSAENARVAAENERRADFESLETDMQTAIGQADAATRAAVALNEQVQSDENDRVAAEQGRVSAEQSRVTAETARETQASSDHTRAEGDHTTAAADHTTATQDHTTAESDHTTASADHTQAVEDHTASVAATGSATDAAATANTAAAAADEAREGIQDDLARKANTDGYYGGMTVGSAENLVGRGSVDAEYGGIRTSAGTADIGSGSATIQKMKGRSFVWNQLIQNGNFEDGITNWGRNAVVSYEVSDNTFHFVASRSGAGIYQNKSHIEGHKYYFGISVKCDTDSTSFRFGFGGNYAQEMPVTNSFSRLSAIIQSTGSGTCNYYSGDLNTIERTYSLKNIIVIDLTLIFGKGNEPSTVDEFDAWRKEMGLTLDYYDYNEGEVINNKAEAIETVGFNLYDPSTGKAFLPGPYSSYPQEYEICGTFSSISFTDVNGNISVPTLTDGRFFNINAPGELTVVGGNNTDTLVHLVWSGWRNYGEPDYAFEPYWKNTLNLNLTQLTGKLNGAGESVVVFPNGLAKVGDARDEIVGNKAIKRIASRAYASGDESDASVLTDGHELTYYVLATPEEYLLDEPLPSQYRVDDFGTERVIPSYSQSNLTAPIAYDVQYAMNAVDAIRRLPNNYVERTDVKQATGQSEEFVLSQKAVDDNYAKKVGIENDLVVGAAKALAGNQRINAEFTTAVMSGADGIVKINEVKGKSLVWNQLYNSVIAYINCVVANNDDGTFTITSNNSAELMQVRNNLTTLIRDHVYLNKFTIIEGGDSVYSLRAAIMTSGNTVIRRPTVNSVFKFSVEGNETAEYYFLYQLYKSSLAETATVTVFLPKLIDLTLMFGAGNEPATVEEFEKLFPLPYYAYNAGEIISNTTESLGVTGFNQWDEEWENGRIDPSTGEDANNNGLRSKNYIPVLSGTSYYYRKGETGANMYACYYDNDKQFISYDNCADVSVTTPAACKFVRFYIPTTAAVASYQHDICINISDPTKNGTYEPYKHADLPMNLSAITGKLNGEGESVVIFPDGMRSAGTAHDYLIVDEDGYARKAVKVVESVDLGTLNWNIETVWLAPLSDAKKPSDNTTAANLLSALYKARPSTGTGADPMSIALNTSSNLVVNNNSSTETPSGMLYYGLAIPLTYDLDEPIQMTFMAYHGGTITQTPQAPDSAPMALNMTYALDAVSTLNGLPQDYISAESIDNFLAVLSTQMNGTWSRTFNENTGKHEFTFTPNANTNEAES